MVNNIQIVPYDLSHKTEVAELLNICLGEKATGCRDEDYWTWKHEQSPFGQSVMLLAECDGRLVGVRAFMRWRLMCDGRTIEAAKPVDTVTHPAYQRRGIFSRLTTQACDDARDVGIGLVFNTPNVNSKPGYLKLGWREVAELPLYAKWLRPASAIWNVVRAKIGSKQAPNTEDFFRDTPRSASEVLVKNLQLDHLFPPNQRVSETSQAASPVATASDPPGGQVAQAALKQQPKSCTTSDGAKGNERIADRFMAGAGNTTNQLETRRDIHFLNWRYGQHPHIQYYAETVGPDANPDGVLFYRTNLRSGLREIMIDDIIVRDGTNTARVELVNLLCSRVDAHYVIAHAADASPELATLRRLRFRRVPRRRFSLVARPLGEDLHVDPFQVANWSLCLGDIEGL